jgi:long-chain acyl-CoA synthetase
MTQTLNRMFHQTATQYATKPAIRYKDEGTWKDLVWADLETEVMKAAAGLISGGLGKGDRVAILSNTRMEWLVADLGATCAGAATVTIYQSNTPDECEYIIANSGTVVVFAEDQEQVDKLRSVRSAIPSVRQVVVFDGEGDGDWVTSFDDLIANGATWNEQNPTGVSDREDEIEDDDLLCLIYTSGTTGRPKGVVLTHKNMVYEGVTCERIRLLDSSDTQLLFLPLAHVFAQVLKAAWLSTGHVLAVTGMDTLLDDMAEIRPTFMASVPRVFEKVYTAVVGKARSAPGIKGALGRWALDQGQAMGKLALAGGKPGGLGWTLAKRLVFSKIGTALSAKFGGRLRFFVSGGAPLSNEINYFFAFAGVEILEGYGMTESSAATCVNLPGHNAIGTVGPVIPGTEVRIAEDGEILISGPGVMQQYWGLDEATAETLIDGWLHTGDLGSIDAAGRLSITGRKKELIITAGGKNIAPAPIEGPLSASPYIGHVVVHGDKRKFLSALVTLDMDNVGTYAEQHNFTLSSTEEAATHPQVLALIQGVFDGVNSALPKYSTIKKFTILPVEFETGEELTPTLKVKRRMVEDKFASALDAMYA